MPTNVFCRARVGESQIGLINRFLKRCRHTGLLSEIIRHDAFVAPSRKRREKAKRAARRKQSER